MAMCRSALAYLMILTCGLSSAASSPTCLISTAFVGEWIQPGLVDSITINNTWCSLKGTCVGQQDVRNKFIFYNEQTRCKRCILFIPRHLNALQYRESECFDADDDDNGRICASITPDTVLYTLFRDNAESTPCPFEQSWYFERNQQLSTPCQPRAFQHCASANTFQLTYNNRCPSDQNVRATCFAHFTDGNINYVVARSLDRERFVCFSYTKMKRDEPDMPPHEVYLSADDTCRDLLTRESAIVLNVLPGAYHRQLESKVQLPSWTYGRWLTVGVGGPTAQTIFINSSQLAMKLNDEHTIIHNLRFVRLLSNRGLNDNAVRLKAKSLEHCSSKFYCLKLVHRSPSVIDLSMGFDEHGCKDPHIHYTLFKPASTSNITCPQAGIYKSLSTYRPSIPVSTCSTGLWTLSVGCEATNRSELTLSSSCRHETVPDVQIITSLKGVCLASWRTDHRFQRTIILYEQTRAFCLIQPLKAMTASWILSDSSCTHLGALSIKVENSLRYFDTCEQQTKAYQYLSANAAAMQRISYLLFSFFICSFTMQVLR